MKITVGTRGSKLAITQTEMACAAIKQVAAGAEIEVLNIKTTGDLKQGTPQASQSDKRDWILELEAGVLDGSLSMAVHSAKDIPHDTHPETVLVPILAREMPNDIWIGKLTAASTRIQFDQIPHSGLVGTASLRRAAFLLKHRPDIRVVEHRGNVPTRLTKLDNNPELSGIVIAYAGLARLGLASTVAFESIPTSVMLPGINQGILAVQLQRQNSALLNILRALVDPATEAQFLAERRCAEILEGDCHSAVGIHAHKSGPNLLTLTATVLDRAASKTISVTRSGRPEEANQIGEQVGLELLDNGAREILIHPRRS